MNFTLVFSVVTSLSVLAGCSTAPKPAAPQAEAAALPAPAPTSLNDTAWALVRLQDQALVLPANTLRPFLSFNAEGRLYGYSGVNRLFGQPVFEGRDVVFGQISSTRMAGPSDSMAIEDRLLECLRLTTSWRIRDGRLELLAGDSRVLAIFNQIPNEDLH